MYFCKKCNNYIDILYNNNMVLLCKYCKYVEEIRHDINIPFRNLRHKENHIIRGPRLVISSFDYYTSNVICPSCKKNCVLIIPGNLKSIQYIIFSCFICKSCKKHFLAYKISYFK
uniref:Uncharacterized protein n=1 Tax=Amorphochlora amoebiformis TaxID=1561963 RepID=A0A0H5BI31_9EUKA|nr:hypothetical protein [Amorphochlora amoebiformis]